WIQIKLRVEREPQNVVQLRIQIVELNLRGENGLLAFEQSRAALDRRDFERVSIEDVVFVFAQHLGRVGSLLFRRVFLKSCDQDAVVQRVHLKSDLIFGFL